MWNSKRYEAGYQAAQEAYTETGAAVAVAEYKALDGARAVDEFEVGFRTFLEERGIDPQDHGTYAAS